MKGSIDKEAPDSTTNSLTPLTLALLEVSRHLDNQLRTWIEMKDANNK